MNEYLLLFSCLCAFVGVTSNPAITLMKCEPGDDMCVTEAVKAAYPLVLEANTEIGAENLDPLYVEEIETNLSVLKFKFFKTNTDGFKSCQVVKASFDVAKLGLYVNLQCPEFVMNGQYEIDGRLITIPVKGNGDYNLKTQLYNITLNVEMKITVGKDGKNYMTVQNFKTKIDPLEPIIFDFKNLFNGQKDLADAVLKFANENWKEIAHEFDEPVFSENVKKIMKNANKYLKTIPVDQFLVL